MRAVVTLSFIVAVRHHDTVRDWTPVQNAIAETVASISSQTSRDWRAVLVANPDTPLPKLPAGVEVCHVALMPPVLPDPSVDGELYYQRIREDKGARLLAGLAHLGARGHVMAVDYDDFVSRDLASHVERNPNEDAWFLDSGYLVEKPGRWAMFKPHGFNNVCGSSLIIKAELYADLLRSEGDERIALAARWLGSHRFIRSDLGERGVRFQPLPFPGAAWRLAGPGETSGARTVLKEITRHTRNPIRMVSRVARLRPVDSRFRAEFYGS